MKHWKLLLWLPCASLIMASAACAPPAKLPHAQLAPYALPSNAANYAAFLPNAKITPGATFPAVTAKDVCTSGYAKRVRNVSQYTKNEVYREYGITNHKSGEYEVDHLISLELGGCNDIHNLWPESYVTKPLNAHIKDRLENKLHTDVCNGSVSLATAQRDIATDWVMAYQKYVGPLPD